MNDAFNYVAVLVSIIIGLAATRLLRAMSEMLATQPLSYFSWADSREVKSH